MAVAVAASLLPFFYHLLVLSASRWLYAGAAYIAYNTSGSLVPGKINVHLVPHSHDDVGWLKTIDQYYVGSNNSIQGKQGACIQNVLDSVVEALLKDKNRKLSSTGGGDSRAIPRRSWCMHDEAAVHYIDMIDQTTLGHQFLKQEFGQVPRIAWQIDPFGHSAVQAYLLGAEVGFDALYFSRIDYQDRQKRTDTKSLEVVWRGSKTLGSSVDIFTGIFPKDYEPPPGGFYFEVNDESPVIQDDPLLFDYNVQERVDDFVAAALSQDARINALYSTPSIYTDAKHAANEAWPLKMDDFFPYADRANAYWTGYFTSRPALKAYAARQLEFLKRGSYGLTTNSLAEALAIAQHHDAITGTEKQHVADDYAKRLAIGYTEAAKLVESTLTSLTESHSSSGHDGGDAVTTKFEQLELNLVRIQNYVLHLPNSEASTDNVAAGTEVVAGTQAITCAKAIYCRRGLAPGNQCSLLNISYCPASESEIKDGRSLVVLVYNSLGWRREDIIRIPVISDAILVTDHEGKIIKSQLLPINSASLSLRKTYVQAYIGNSPSVTPKYWLAFPVTVEALGFSTYFIRSSETRGTHAFMSIVDSSQEQTYSYYVGNNGSEIDPQASGAYVFRPSGKFPIESDKVENSSSLSGGMPETSSGNTLGNSRTTSTFPTFWSTASGIETILARNPWYPLVMSFLALMQEMRCGLCLFLVTSKINCSPRGGRTDVDLRRKSIEVPFCDNQSIPRIMSN
ncbi:hypothetical protein ZIOFF_013770 [Zingiber officinale]|uniref:Glycoside hydrolase family 38 central domain-containing protein n=1 Tax=Zingiber officinale TaxID=94328 RepID=A0A8J5HC42_ZINOF|nr:hypothetical protein ZIOFF_013770 [Zingiber officinale]